MQIPHQYMVIPLHDLPCIDHTILLLPRPALLNSLRPALQKYPDVPGQMIHLPT